MQYKCHWLASNVNKYIIYTEMMKLGGIQIVSWKGVFLRAEDGVAFLCVSANSSFKVIYGK